MQIRTRSARAIAPGRGKRREAARAGRDGPPAGSALADGNRAGRAALCAQQAEAALADAPLADLAAADLASPDEALRQVRSGPMLKMHPVVPGALESSVWAALVDGAGAPTGDAAFQKILGVLRGAEGSWRGARLARRRRRRAVHAFAAMDAHPRQAVAGPAADCRSAAARLAMTHLVRADDAAVLANEGQPSPPERAAGACRAPGVHGASGGRR